MYTCTLHVGHGHSMMETDLFTDVVLQVPGDEGVAGVSPALLGVELSPAEGLTAGALAVLQALAVLLHEVHRLAPLLSHGHGLAGLLCHGLGDAGADGGGGGGVAVLGQLPTIEA